MLPEASGKEPRFMRPAPKASARLHRSSLSLVPRRGKRSLSLVPRHKDEDTDHTVLPSGDEDDKDPEVVAVSDDDSEIPEADDDVEGPDVHCDSWREAVSRKLVWMIRYSLVEFCDDQGYISGARVLALFHQGVGFHKFRDITKESLFRCALGAGPRKQTLPGSRFCYWEIALRFGRIQGQGLGLEDTF